jgi:putative ABC transport system permease protein
MDPPPRILYFNAKYLEEAVPWFKGTAGFYDTRVETENDVPEVEKAIDDMFHNAPAPTKSESEHAFRLSFIAQLGNVKAFILSICGAVVFTILLVSANTMAMSVRSRTSEVAVLKTLGFTKQRVLSLFVGESVALAVIGGLLGIGCTVLLTLFLSKSPVAVGVPAGFRVTPPTMLVALLVAAFVGLLSGLIPAYNASRTSIVEGLRHIG